MHLLLHLVFILFLYCDSHLIFLSEGATKFEKKTESFLYLIPTIYRLLGYLT